MEKIEQLYSLHEPKLNEAIAAELEVEDSSEASEVIEKNIDGRKPKNEIKKALANE